MIMMFEMVRSRGWRVVHFVSNLQMYRGFVLAVVPMGRLQKVLMKMISSPEVMMTLRKTVGQTLQKNLMAVEGRSHFLEKLEQSKM